MKRKVYILEGLDCANCAAKIENKLSKMPGLSDVSVTYATKQLRLSAEDPDALLPQVREVVKSMEPDVEVVERTRGGKQTQTHEHSHHDHDHHDHEHHHEHGAGCGCVHDHHDHEHHHDHGESCGCGHDHHDHEHHHDHKEGPHATRSHTHFVEEFHHVEGHPEDCDCEQCHSFVEYCDVCGESLAKCTCHMPDEDLEKRVYILEGIDCANCAAKIEAKIRQMPEVGFASVAFATKQLRVSANNQDELLPKMQAVVDSIEDGVTIVPRKRKKITSVSDTKLYILEGLDCANCAAKIEAKLKTMDGVDDVTITYATRQMKLSAKNPDAMIPAIQATIDSMEDGVTVVPKERNVAAAAGEKKEPIWKNPLFSIGIGAALFVVGEILEHVGAGQIPLLVLFLIAYLILGGKVLMTAARNIAKGQVRAEPFPDHGGCGSAAGSGKPCGW